MKTSRSNDIGRPAPGQDRIASGTAWRLPAAAWLLAGAAASAWGQSGTADADRAYCERQEGIAKEVCLRNLASTPKAPAAGGASAPNAAPGAAAASAGSGGAAAAGGAAPYKVVDGYHVDPVTFKGFQTWRAAACDRCHGANQEGLVGPSLVNSLKTLSQADFEKTVTNGRLEKGMPSFAANPQVVNNLGPLYAYLKGRSDGAITKSHVERME